MLPILNASCHLGKENLRKREKHGGDRGEANATPKERAQRGVPHKTALRVTCGHACAPTTSTGGQGCPLRAGETGSGMPGAPM